MLPPPSYSYKGNGTPLVTRRSRLFPHPKCWYLPAYLLPTWLQAVTTQTTATVAINVMRTSAVI